MALNSTNQPIRWKERIGRVAIGHGIKQTEETVFDYMLYPAVIAWAGGVYGGLIMTALSAFVCYLYLLAYDWSGKDWFGFELLKEARDGEEKQGEVARFMQSLVRKGNWLSFVALSLYTDPFMTTVYMRQGAGTYSGLSPRDWGVFWGSVLTANIWWTIAMTGVVASARSAIGWFWS